MLDFGAIIEYSEAHENEALLHVSELTWKRKEKNS